MANKQTTLSNSFCLKGEWWLPDAPQKKVDGELNFSPDGPCELSLAGALREFSPGPWRPLSVPVILGNTIDGKICSIIDAYESGFQMHSSGTAVTKFFYNQIFIGAETVDPSTTTFESALVRFNELGGWLHRDPFDIRGNRGIDGKVIMEYHMPRGISVRVPPLEAIFRFEPMILSTSEYQKRTFVHVDSLRLKPNRKQSLQWYLDAIFRFRILLSLLLGEPANLTSIQMCSRLRRSLQFGPKPYREYIDLCLRQISKQRGKELLPPEMPFPYSVLHKHLRGILKRWYENANRMQTVYGLHFAIQVNSGTPVEFAFLALLQAIEAYHREKGIDKYMADGRYSPIRDALVRAIPHYVSADFRTALKSRIKFGNEYSLRKRLTLTFRSIPKSVAMMITEGDTHFIEKVVATRNYLTHRDQSQRDSVMNFKGMFNANESLKLLIIYLLLHECGLPPSLVEEAMLTHTRFKNRPRIM